MKVKLFSISSTLYIVLTLNSSYALSKNLTISSEQQNNVSLTLLPNGNTLIQDSRFIGPVNKDDTVIITDLAPLREKSRLEIANSENIGPISQQFNSLAPQAQFKYRTNSPARNIQISYLNNTISFDNEYVLTLVKNQLTLQAFTTIYNQSNVTFNNTIINILNNRSAQRPANKKLLTTAQALQMVNAADKKNSKAFKATHSEQLTLLTQQSVKIPFLNINNLSSALSFEYNTSINEGANNNHSKRAATVNVHIRNGAKTNIKYLNKGIVSLYQQSDSGQQKLISEGPLLFSQTANDLALTLGASKDIFIEQRQTSSQKTFNGEIINLQFKITNQSANTKSIRLKSNFNSRYNIISSPVRAQKGTRHAIWQIPVTGNNISVFTISARLFNDQK